jgi:electron transfer flavoprotein beta subunit
MTNRSPVANFAARKDFEFMKILVLISHVPDTTARIAFTNDNTAYDASGIQFIVNPYDEWYALVRGLELKEAQGGTVTTITVGGAETDPTIRKALAIGADDAVRIDTAPKDGHDVAAQVAAYAKDKGFDLILAGKETIDHNGSQVGPMLAEMLDLPFISLAGKLDVADNKATAERDVRGDVEVLECALPLVVSCAKGMAEQRIPNMRGIMAARTKPLQVVPAAATEALSTTVKFELPPPKQAVKMIPAEEAGKLIELLHSEAKVI